MRRLAYLVVLLLAERVAYAQTQPECDPETGECVPPAPPNQAPGAAPATPCDPETSDCTNAPSSEEPPVELECDPETGECTMPSQGPAPASEGTACDPSKGPCPEAPATSAPPEPANAPKAPEATAPACDPASAECAAQDEAAAAPPVVVACDPASGNCPGQTPKTETTETCDPTQSDCACPRNWGCWELLYTTKGTVIGGKVTFTFGDAQAHDRVHVGFVTFYNTEHFATRKYLSVHALGFGSVGGGTAGNEGSLGLGLDVGFRGEITEKSGPFVRLGMSGLLLGNHSFFVSYLEPIQERVGYQVLDGDTVIELGATHGTIPIARFDPGRHVSRDLSRTQEFGGYAAVHFQEFRVDGSFMHILGDGRRDVELARGMFCNYQLGVTLCADAFFARGRAEVSGQRAMTNSLYMGLTVGLSP